MFAFIDTGHRDAPQTTQLTARRTTSYQATAVLAGLICYALRLAHLIARNAVNIFFSDQWEFNDATLFHRRSLWQTFVYQHAWHGQGVGAVFETIVDPLLSWNSRSECWVALALVILTAVCALWLKCRLYGPLSILDLAIPAILLTPAQYESLFVTLNFSQGVFPLLLLVLSGLAWTCPGPRPRYGTILVLNFLALYTGFTLFVGFLTPGLLLLDYFASPRETRAARRYLFGSLLVASASLALFFHGYRFNADIDCFSPAPRSPAHCLAFVALIFARFFAINHADLRDVLLGCVLLSLPSAVLSIALFRLLGAIRKAQAADRRNQLICTVLLTGLSLLVCTSAAYGRLCGGVDLALAPRYAIYVEPAMLGSYLFLLNARTRRFGRLPLVMFAVAVLAASFHLDSRGIADFREGKQRWRTCYLKREDIETCDTETGYAIYTHPPERTHLKEKLKYLKAAGINLYSW